MAGGRSPAAEARFVRRRLPSGREVNMTPPRSLIILGIRSASLGFATLLVLACGDLTAPRWIVRRGTVQADPVAPRLDVPQPIIAGQPGVFTVYTFGGGCVRPASTQSAVSGPAAVIEPFDSVVVELPANMACTTEFRSFLHSATLVFSQPGPATIRVVGWKEPEQVEITLEWSVAVQ